MLLIPVSSFIKSYWPLLRMLSCPQDQDHVHPHKLFLYWEYVKPCLHPPKYSTPTLEVDKNMSWNKYFMFYKIVISLNMWLKRHEGYAKKYLKKGDTWRSQSIEKIYDEHMKTHKKRKKRENNDSHISKYKFMREITHIKEYSINLTLYYPHTCTSWSDPSFDLTNMQGKYAFISFPKQRSIQAF
jgi:hypothetical protein